MRARSRRPNGSIEVQGPVNGYGTGRVGIESRATCWGVYWIVLVDVSQIVIGQKYKRAVGFPEAVV
jgi:hypothetical protein